MRGRCSIKWESIAFYLKIGSRESERSGLRIGALEIQLTSHESMNEWKAVLTPIAYCNFG